MTVGRARTAGAPLARFTSTPTARWLVTVSVLWTAMWCLPLLLGWLDWIPPISVTRVVELGVFAAACVVTVMFGHSMARHTGARWILRSAGLGTLVLWAWSWALVLIATVTLIVTGGDPVGIVGVLLFGLPISMVLAGFGFLFLLCLLGAGTLVAQLQHR